MNKLFFSRVNITLNDASQKKLKKWGYKLQAHAGLSGYVYDFEVDGGIGSKGVPTNCDPRGECGETPK